MRYDILETHCVYDENGIIQLVAVVWFSNKEKTFKRATYCTNKVCHGYEFLTKVTKVDEHLFQRVAAAGMNLPEDLCKRYFNHLFEY